MANSKIVASAGEHYVAYVLSNLGYIAALVRAGSPAIDLLVASTDGINTVGIQIKTTENALRTRGRGKEKTPHELQFPLGHKAVEDAIPGIIFCFVDLRGFDPQNTPDVYVIPSEVLIDLFKGIDIRQYSYFRLHRPIEWMEEYKNNWQPFTSALEKYITKT